MNKKDTSRVLDAVAREHVPDDINLLPGILERIEKANRSKMKHRAKLLTAVVLILLVLAVILASVPGAATAMKRLFGYIPEVGIVEQGAPLRVLAEPVSATRDGITVSVNRAYLIAEKTMLDIGVSGVPLSAYPQGEAVSGCIEQEYLRLPDGTQQGLDAPIPADVNEATFVMPCIFNTLPGSAPTGWELALRFVPAPPDLTVMPVIELTSTLPAAATLPPAAVVAKESSTPAVAQGPSVTIDKVIQTGDGYILIGALHPQIPAGSSAQVTGVPLIRDANGKKVAYSIPQDIQQDLGLDMTFAYQITAAGLAFPLTIEFPGVVISPADPQATAEFTFDAGPDPQPGQVWTLNQDIQIAGHTLKLVSVTADSRNGYSFEFRSGKDIYSVGVQIEGYTPVGGGGGGPLQGLFQTSVSYAELPKGKLKVILSNLTVAGEPQSWQGHWQPEGPPPVWPTPTAAPYPVCLNPDSINQLKQLPAGLDGRILLTEMNPALNLVLAGIDGSQRQVLAPGGSRGALNADGGRLAYPTDEGIAIMDLTSGETSVLKGIQGRDLRWSPDSSQIAYVTAGDVYGVYVVGSDGKHPIQLSNLGYESIAGWSPDGKQLYYAIPGSSNKGFLLRGVNLATGETRDLFVLENSSRKAPMPAISSDGKWVAYRGADNSSVYLIHTDGTQGHLLIENPSPGYAVSGIAWGPGGGLLGLSLITPQDQDGEVILIQPSGCEAYLLPSLHGELDGVLIP